MSKPISILLVDDHRTLRSGLQNLIAAQSDMTIVAQADNGRRAVELARDLAPDVVLMDITMPELNGVEATRQIVHDTPGAKVIVMSAHSDRSYVSDALKAGAVGFFPKASSFDELALAIRRVAAGNVYLSPCVADSILDDYVRGCRKTFDWADCQGFPDTAVRNS